MSGNAVHKTASVLIFRIGQLGDTLLSLPAIHSIRQRHPNHRLVLLTERQPSELGYISSWDVLKPTGWFDEVMFYTPARSIADKLATMWLLARSIRTLGPEFIYDIAPERTLRQSRRDRIFFKWIAGAREYRGGGFLLKPPKDARQLLPRLEPEWKRLLRVIGDDRTFIDFRMPIPEEEQRKAREILDQQVLNNSGRQLAVGPGSKMPSKIWPRDRFRELGLRLLADYPDLCLLVFGGKEDAEIGDDLCATWGKRSRNLAGRLSVYGSAAALQRCVAYVGNDSGAMHLAGMAGIPCVALFSARDYPGQWEPYGDGHKILRHEMECAGCMRVICPYENRCLDLITVDEAIRSARNVLTNIDRTRIAGQHGNSN